MFNFNFTYYRLAPSARQTSVPSVSAISLTLSVGPSKCRCTLLSAKPTEGMELSSYTEADKTGQNRCRHPAQGSVSVSGVTAHHFGSLPSLQTQSM